MGIFLIRKVQSEELSASEFVKITVGDTEEHESIMQEAFNDFREPLLSA